MTGDIPVYEAKALAGLPQFMKCLAFCNQALLSIHKQMPREVRYVADVRRWILTHAALLLHFQRRVDPSAPLLTATNLYGLIEDSSMVSPNTVTNYLKEIENFGYIEAVSSQDGRVRAYQMSAFSEQMFHVYLNVNLQALDQIDGAGRSEVTRAKPEILNHMHPIFARLMLRDAFLRAPPQSIVQLVSTTVGMSVLNEMTKSVTELPTGDIDRIEIALDSASSMAQRYGVSRGNIARLLKKIASENDFGKIGKKSWISGRLVRDYHQWQGRKFAHVSSAYVEACHQHNTMSAAT
ncbi:hypothetical protein JK191_14210 [Gluconobacter sphaericus]|uniref:hypothetical protein n=1 Tax=Gluconobacter sphaericus TaxID=574987 RepID=UPI001B8C9F5E|nr:hypothetical protein [Gluconobacter sphaericus]MBS1098666.1 hypothetical protein [Gluconobacter sphaericus]